MSKHERLWMKQHSRAEKRLAKVLAKFFSLQIADAVRRLNDLEKSLADLVFDPQTWDEKLREVVWPELQRNALTGAQVELEVFGVKELTDIRESEYFVELPDPVLNGINASLTELIESEYFSDISRTTQHDISRVIQLGIANGDSTPEIAKRIQAELGGDATKVRALRIARTETTGSLNAGHHVVRETLAADGLVSGHEWLTVGDDDVRESHASLNKAQIGIKEQFDVGGTFAPYPGHHSLPVHERANCRCTTVSILGEMAP